MRYRFLYCLICLPLVFIMAPDSPPPSAATVCEPVKEFVDLDGPLPDEPAMTRMAERDPILFFKWCLTRCNREVKGYRVVMKKQERISEKMGGTGKLMPSQEVKVSFLEKPFSVLFIYEKDPRPAQ